MKYSSLHPVAMKPALPTSISTSRRQRRRVGAPTPNCPDLSAPGAGCKVLSTSVRNGISCKCNLSWLRCVFQGRCCVAQKLAVLAWSCVPSHSFPCCVVKCAHTDLHRCAHRHRHTHAVLLVRD